MPGYCEPWPGKRAASLPRTGPEPKAVPNGEPLSIGEHTEKYRYTVKEKVGEVRHQDSHGRSTGKSTLYADRTKVGTLHTWNAYQGDEKISDDDLYRIAKDEEADREVRSMREKSRDWSWATVKPLQSGLLGPPQLHAS